MAGVYALLFIATAALAFVALPWVAERARRDAERAWQREQRRARARFLRDVGSYRRDFEPCGALERMGREMDIL